MNNGMPMMNGMPDMYNMQANDMQMPMYPPMGGQMIGPMPAGGCQCTAKLKVINERLDHMERQIKALDRRVDNLAGFHKTGSAPFGNASAQNETNMSNQYPQYQSGNYML